MRTQKRNPCGRAQVSIALIVFAMLGMPFVPAVATTREAPQEVAQKTTENCPSCKKELEEGWCDKCRRGFARGLETTCRSCLIAIQGDGWCEGCSVGYVDGKKTACRSCFAAMAAPIGAWCEDCGVGYSKGVKTKCRSCLAALQEDGWCESCSVGYVDGDKTTCRTCFVAMIDVDGGWCTDCGVGYSKGLSTKCKACLAAMRTDGACDACGIRFKEGRSFVKVSLRVEKLDEGKAKKLRATLATRPDVTGLQLDFSKGTVGFELETTRGSSAVDIVSLLGAAGIAARDVRTD